MDLPRENGGITVVLIIGIAVIIFITFIAGNIIGERIGQLDICKKLASPSIDTVLKFKDFDEAYEFVKILKRIDVKYEITPVEKQYQVKFIGTN